MLPWSETERSKVGICQSLFVFYRVRFSYLFYYNLVTIICSTTSCQLSLSSPYFLKPIVKTEIPLLFNIFMYITVDFYMQIITSFRNTSMLLFVTLVLQWTTNNFGLMCIIYRLVNFVLSQFTWTSRPYSCNETISNRPRTINRTQYWQNYSYFLFLLSLFCEFLLRLLYWNQSILKFGWKSILREKEDKNLHKRILWEINESVRLVSTELNFLLWGNPCSNWR